MRISERPVHVSIGGRDIQFRRITGGVLEIRGRDDFDFASGLGFTHACDRALQILLTRLVGQGRLSECLAGSDENLRIDVFMREMGFARYAAMETAEMASDTKHFVDAYTEGVNRGLQLCGTPFELRLAGYRPEPWHTADTFTTAKLMSYVGLAQAQQDAEKFIIQALASDVRAETLRRLFSPWLDGVDENLVELLKQVRIEQPLLPPEVRGVLPGPMASNNWAVAGSLTASGAPLQCNDPHLECNRLPAIWYEVVAHIKDDFRIGITMPGMPGLIMGRTRALSMGFTYGFMDMVDYFIEELSEGRFRRGASWADFDARTEKILRRKKAPVEITVRENMHGVLEADSRNPRIQDGLYLCRAYANHRGGVANSLEAIRRLPLARTVDEAIESLRGFANSFNYVFADRTGNIGYRQTGRLPRRGHSGLYPTAGWDQANDWHGFVDDRELTCFRNPPEGFIITANNDTDLPGYPRTINLCMGSGRAERIRRLLENGRKHSIDDMQRIQTDVYSTQAERLMSRLRPLLPETPAARLLAGWDLRYDRESRGATVFEEVLRELLERIFGDNVFGLGVWRSLRDSSSLPHIYHHILDRILLGPDDPWFFGPAGQNALYREVLARVLSGIDPARVRPWGSTQSVTMRNILLGRRLPRFLGFDYGPVSLEGGRATVVQCGIFRSHGRLAAVYPSYRYVADLAEEGVHSALAGGPSDRRFTGHYTTDIENWLHGRYKELKNR
jgi:penicillin amidase